MFLETVLLHFYLLFVPACAGFTAAAGAVALTLATGSHGGAAGATGLMLRVLHLIFRRTSVMLTAVSCGLVGAGVAGVGFTTMLVAIAWIWDRLAPTSTANLSENLLLAVHACSMVLGFLVGFALGMDGLVGWLNARQAPRLGSSTLRKDLADETPPDANRGGMIR